MKGIDSALHDLSELTESELKASRLPEPQKQSAPLRKSGSGRGDGGINGKQPAASSPPDSSTSAQTSSYEGPVPTQAASLTELSELSAQLVDDERWDAALGVVGEEHELMCLIHGESDVRTLQVLSTYAGVLWQLGRGVDARDLLQELANKRTQVRRILFFCTRAPPCTALTLTLRSCVCIAGSRRSRSVKRRPQQGGGGPRRYALRALYRPHRARAAFRGCAAVTALPADPDGTPR